MGAEQIAFGIAQMKHYQLVTGGDAKTGGIGIINSGVFDHLQGVSLLKRHLAGVDQFVFHQHVPGFFAFGIAQMKHYQLVTGGDAKTGGIGIITEPRLKKTRRL
jgi:hypothetical protein